MDLPYQVSIRKTSFFLEAVGRTSGLGLRKHPNPHCFYSGLVPRTQADSISGIGIPVLPYGDHSPSLFYKYHGLQDLESTLRVANPQSHKEPGTVGNTIAGRTLTVDTRDGASIWTKANLTQFPHLQNRDQGPSCRGGQAQPPREQERDLPKPGG